MNDGKTVCWAVSVQWMEMDMSGGDNVDGPRWNGKRFPVDSEIYIVAPTENLAAAAAFGIFYDHQKPKVLKCEKVAEVSAVVEVFRMRNS